VSVAKKKISSFRKPFNIQDSHCTNKMRLFLILILAMVVVAGGALTNLALTEVKMRRATKTSLVFSLAHTPDLGADITLQEMTCGYHNCVMNFSEDEWCRGFTAGFNTKETIQTYISGLLKAANETPVLLQGYLNVVRMQVLQQLALSAAEDMERSNEREENMVNEINDDDDEEMEHDGYKFYTFCVKPGQGHVTMPSETMRGKFGQIVDVMAAETKEQESQHRDRRMQKQKRRDGKGQENKCRDEKNQGHSRLDGVLRIGIEHVDLAFSIGGGEADSVILKIRIAVCMPGTVTGDKLLVLGDSFYFVDIDTDELVLVGGEEERPERAASIWWHAGIREDILTATGLYDNDNDKDKDKDKVTEDPLQIKKDDGDVYGYDDEKSKSKVSSAIKSKQNIHAVTSVVLAKMFSQISIPLPIRVSNSMSFRSLRGKSRHYDINVALDLRPSLQVMDASALMPNDEPLQYFHRVQLDIFHLLAKVNIGGRANTRDEAA
jgi:hypothetical protein